MYKSILSHHNITKKQKKKIRWKWKNLLHTKCKDNNHNSGNKKIGIAFQNVILVSTNTKYINKQELGKLIF